MNQLVWQAEPRGRYVIDLAVAQRSFQCVVDLGLIDPRHQVGAILNPLAFDSLKQNGSFSRVEIRLLRNASGMKATTRCGLTTVQLLDASKRETVGPPVSMFVGRGSALVSNLVGVVFFHQLLGCRVQWDLEHRLWSMEYP